MTSDRCAWCGQIAQGHAYIGDKRFCHGDDMDAFLAGKPQPPTCYELASGNAWRIWFPESLVLADDTD